MNMLLSDFVGHFGDLSWTFRVLKPSITSNHVFINYFYQYHVKRNQHSKPITHDRYRKWKVKKIIFHHWFCCESRGITNTYHQTNCETFHCQSIRSDCGIYCVHWRLIPWHIVSCIMAIVQFLRRYILVDICVSLLSFTNISSLSNLRYLGWYGISGSNVFHWSIGFSNTLWILLRSSPTQGIDTFFSILHLAAHPISHPIHITSNNRLFSLMYVPLTPCWYTTRCPWWLPVVSSWLEHPSGPTHFKPKNSPCCIWDRYGSRIGAVVVVVIVGGGGGVGIGIGIAYVLHHSLESFPTSINTIIQHLTPSHSPPLYQHTYVHVVCLGLWIRYLRCD